MSSDLLSKGKEAVVDALSKATEAVHIGGSQATSSIAKSEQSEETKTEGALQ